MKFLRVKMCVAFFAALILFSFQPAYWQSKFIKVDQDGTISYIPDEKGNIIPDFSRVGYHKGNRDIPVLPIVKTLSPSGSSTDEAAIQSAINELSKRDPDKNGFRGAILLKKGVYKIPGTIHINASGIVLRGEGDEQYGTKLIATGKDKRNLISISGQGSLAEVTGSRRKIADSYVPVGAFSFMLESASGLKAGDKIVVLRPGTKNWISDIKMDQIVERQGTKQWQAKEYDLHFEREITKIEGNKVFIDNPVVMAMEANYGGGEIYKYSFNNRIAEVGIENMRFESEYANDTDEEHSWIAVEINKAENCWVKNVTSKYFAYSCVSLENDAKFITIRDSKCLDAKSVITGGRRYSFNNDGQLNLFMNLETTEGRHDFVTGAKVLGPNVFYNCKASQTHADIGPHHRWAVGTLYDNVQTDGAINVQDRGKMGSGHGWSGANQVVWNCKAKEAAVQNPWASAKNYCIGFQGKKAGGAFPDRTDGEWEGHNQPGLTPPSLYRAQLEARQNSKEE
ncbi:hypothetical protein ACFSJU_07990 [Paradesertivirga mongoliensis]|uniref:Pectate lyase superfamily protein domain-containing protein n=1 Tax=Paradesertivirga mongoliensis TaxID=2100740 RepID=A0ABW4ZLB2_9SPHI|nr:hypothetical protein [Pedobacter mongoliensis]